jgi:hypothetical protein
MFSNPPRPPVFVHHSARPSWGRCLIAAEHDGKIYLQAEDGLEHVIAATHRAQLVVVTPDADEFAALMARIQGRRIATGTKSNKPKRPPPQRPSFDEQLQRFSAISPGGFTAPDSPAIARAQSALNAQSLSDPRAFSSIQILVAEAGLLHPMEGQIPLRSIPDAHRENLVGALRELLHGSEEYGARFDRWIAVFTAAKEGGSAKGPSWPLTTLLSALYAPKEHVLVKPKLFQEQAKILELPLAYNSLPNGVVYEQFRNVATGLESRLRERGLAPQHLMDVSSFISLTLSTAKT